MATTIHGNIYELNRGIQDILPFEASALPDKANLAPTDASRSALLHSMYAARNCETLIAAFLRPAVRNLENLKPDRYRHSLRGCKEALQDTDDPALIALKELLEEEGERATLLSSFQGLLLAG
ncbi:MAG: hypothetical protein LBV80_02705 [Deltaproteobacteria bacterium]|jgi:type III secretion protein X|nr:hypothetical protein [Deltaproteobacteria bacterium]